MHCCFTTWILYSINQSWKQNSNFQFTCLVYKHISSPKRLHIKYKFGAPNHVSSNIGVICECIESLKLSIHTPIPCNLTYISMQILFTCFDCINEITNNYPNLNRFWPKKKHLSMGRIQFKPKSLNITQKIQGGFYHDVKC
jgi:hypothetical protein